MAYFGKSKTDSAFQKLEPRTIFLVLWTLLCAVVLGLILKGGIQLPQTSTVTSVVPSTTTVASVLVPKMIIPAGQKLSADLFTIEQYDVQGIQNKIFSNLSEIDGAYSTTIIQDKTPLNRDSVTFTTPRNAVASKIPEGFRAITIPVDAESGVEGWVRPGVKVDVVWISTIRSKQVVSTIVQNAEVLSAERSTDAESGSKGIPTHITLLTSTNDAQRIQLAKSSGSLSLNLRGNGDNTQSTGNTLTIDGLLNKEGDVPDMNTVGWIEIGDKQYEVSTAGKLTPTQNKKEAGLFADDIKKK